MSADFTVTRSIRVDSSPAEVLAHVDDFRRWRDWSPWESADPDLRRDYTGAERGVGAAYAWSGNRKAGAGNMQVVGVVPGQQVDIALEFTKPFKANNAVTFTFAEAAAGQTEVTWTMRGRTLLLMRVLGPLVNMDKMIGPDFEKGLAALKKVCEQG